MPNLFKVNKTLVFIQFVPSFECSITVGTFKWLLVAMVACVRLQPTLRRVTFTTKVTQKLIFSYKYNVDLIYQLGNRFRLEGPTQALRAGRLLVDCLGTLPGMTGPIT